MSKKVNLAAKALSLPQFRRKRIVKDKRYLMKNGMKRNVPGKANRYDFDAE